MHQQNVAAAVGTFLIVSFFPRCCSCWTDENCSDNNESQVSHFVWIFVKVLSMNRLSVIPFNCVTLWPDRRVCLRTGFAPAHIILTPRYPCVHLAPTVRNTIISTVAPLFAMLWQTLRHGFELHLSVWDPGHLRLSLEVLSTCESLVDVSSNEDSTVKQAVSEEGVT